MENIKTLIIGQEKSGKTTLCNKLCYNIIPTKYSPTIKDDYFLYKTKIGSISVKLQIFDILQQKPEHIYLFKNLKDIQLFIIILNNKNTAATDLEVFKVLAKSINQNASIIPIFNFNSKILLPLGQQNDTDVLINKEISQIEQLFSAYQQYNQIQIVDLINDTQKQLQQKIDQNLLNVYTELIKQCSLQMFNKQSEQPIENNDNKDDFDDKSLINHIYEKQVEEEEEEENEEEELHLDHLPSNTLSQIQLLNKRMDTIEYNLSCNQAQMDLRLKKIEGSLNVLLNKLAHK